MTHGTREVTIDEGRKDYLTFGDGFRLGCGFIFAIIIWGIFLAVLAGVLAFMFDPAFYEYVLELWGELQASLNQPQ